MSLIIPTVARLKPEIRLAEAISQFDASVSAAQKATFRTDRSQALHSPPEPGNVIRLTADIDRSERAGSRCYGPRFTNFLHGVPQFAALGDVIIGGSQNIIACGVWSLVRMSLLVSGLYCILHLEVLGEREEEENSSLELSTNEMNDVSKFEVLGRGDVEQSIWDTSVLTLLTTTRQLSSRLRTSKVSP
jgi:hypothetical protein